MIERERQAELDRILHRVTAENKIDLEATEFFVRTAVLALGGRILQEVMDRWGVEGTAEPVPCSCGQPMTSEGFRPKTIRTILGQVTVRRRLYRCGHCGALRFPADPALDIEGTSFSPACRHMMTRAGSQSPFAEAAADLQFYAHVTVSPKDVERVAETMGREMDNWMQRHASHARMLDGQGKTPPNLPEPIDILYVSYDGTGTPMRRSELTRTKSKTPGQPARTHEAKLGCVFTQTTVDDQGRPIRDPASTTYVGAIEDSTDFGYRIFGEAIRRGMRKARLVVILMDGAAYNKSIAAEHFPHAILIIDLYHAREHLDALAKLLLPESRRPAILEQWKRLLDQGQIETLLAAVRTHLPRSGRRRQTALKGLRYFIENTPYMRYAEFRKQGLFVGSGVIEAGCKTLIGKRLKQSGMFWTDRGANAILAARCCHRSGRAEQFWEDRAA